MAAATPNEVLEKLKAENRPAYVLLLTGIGFFMAAAIVLALVKSGVTMEELLGVGVAIIVAAIAIYVCVEVVQNTAIRAVLSWAVCLAILGTMSAAAVSVLRPDWVPPISCWGPWTSKECPGDVAAANAAAAAAQADSKAAEVGSPACSCDEPLPVVTEIDRGKYKIYVQFAGVIVRADVIAQAEQLHQAGWTMDPETLTRGGERTANAAGLNVVRHAPGDEAAAALLASDATAIALNGGRRIGTDANTLLKPGTLELWISR